MDHAEAVDVIDAGVAERQPLAGIGNFESCRHAEQGKPLLCQLDALRGEVRADVPRTTTRELQTIGRDPAPDLDDVLVAERVEPGNDRDVPFAAAVSASR